MLPLYVYGGLYDVGLTTFGLRVPQTTVGKGVLANGSPALVAEEIVFSVFYPAKVHPKSHLGVQWSFRPLSNVSKGFSKFLGYSRWMLLPLVYISRFIKIPVYPMARLLTPPVCNDEPAKWPLVIFSHGLAGSRHMYSHFCARLASEGYVVVALEHHDGTSAYCMVRSAEGNLNSKYYLKADEVKFKSDTSGAFSLRVDQLALRSQEIYQAYSALRDICDPNEGHGDIYLIDGDSSEFSWTEWKGKIDMDANVTLAGHSFGGATVLYTLSTPPPNLLLPNTKTTPTQIPISHAIVLDPWLEPLPLPGPEPTPPAGRKAFTLTVINSEGFTLWKSHFERLKELTFHWGKMGSSSLFTLVRSTHSSFSDFPLLFPFRWSRGQAMLELIHQITITSIQGHSALDKFISRLKNEGRLRAMEIVAKNSGRQAKSMLVGQTGDVILH